MKNVHRAQNVAQSTLWKNARTVLMDGRFQVNLVSLLSPWFSMSVILILGIVMERAVPIKKYLGNYCVQLSSIKQLMYRNYHENLGGPGKIGGCAPLAPT